LNGLAKAGFDTPDSLKNSPKDVIAAIKTLTGDDDGNSTRQTRRQFLSAIFWVAKFPKKNPYYTYYQKCLPITNATTGEAWVPRAKYTE
jgi:hypothetical protein